MTAGTFLTGGTVRVASIERRLLPVDTGEPMPYVVVEVHDLLTEPSRSGLLQIVMGIELAADLEVGERYHIELRPAGRSVLDNSRVVAERRS